MTAAVTTRLRVPGPPEMQAALAIWVIVTDPDDRVLLGRHRTGAIDLPGGKIDPGESLEEAAARELAEETGLQADPRDVCVFALFLDDVDGTTRVTVGAVVTRYQGQAAVQPGEAHTAWDWHELDALPDGLFVPCGQVLRAYRPHLPIIHPPTRHYRVQHAGRLEPPDAGPAANATLPAYLQSGEGQDEPA
ncbi:MAG: NUDIX domain-containing protein [Streptomyces sp.]|nr:NUDIX domain-containing protein [Streptomyces sp.]NUR25605.1 NUDIX domain-containing protein [Catenulispora sp.]